MPDMRGIFNLTDSELVTLKQDAERYRWLRDKAGNAIMEDLMRVCHCDQWDQRVDSAMGCAQGKRSDVP